MKIIRKNPNEGGAYPAIQEGNFRVVPDGYAQWPDELPTKVFYDYNGFIIPAFQNDVIQSYEPNVEAYEAWKALQPTPPDPLEVARTTKEQEISSACNAAIVAGMDVETTQGIEHFSLEETDQINLTNAVGAIQQGSTGYPYHADGQICRLFTAEEINAIGTAATRHKLYHTTLCNHLLTWARRAASEGELSTITYSANNLPADLAENMAAILAATGVAV